MISRDEAVELLCLWEVSASLRRHLRAVEIVMIAFAKHLNEPEPGFAVAGLLHDADWEIAPETHPATIVAWCRERDADEVAHAIAAHGISWGIVHENNLDRALVAADEPAGLVMAASKIHPDGLGGITAASVLKKFKSKSFAAGISRLEVAAGADLLGWPLLQLFDFIIEALRPHAAELEGESTAQ